MSYSIEDIEGIGPALSEKLSAAGITNTKHLLAECGSAAGRRAVATTTGLTESQLLKFANMADLMRISGVGGQYAELLKASGVDTVKELKGRNAANLATKLAEVNESKKLAKNTPNSSMVTQWIEAAADLEPAITH